MKQSIPYKILSSQIFNLKLKSYILRVSKVKRARFLQKIKHLCSFLRHIFLPYTPHNEFFYYDISKI